MKTNKLCKDHINPKCKHENCNKTANYRKLKIGNCTLKSTCFEYCSYHRPKIVLILNFLINQFLIKKEIPLEYN